MARISQRQVSNIDLLKLYGVVEYEWDLIRDTIQWIGPIHKLLNANTPFVTGTSFTNHLDAGNFWYRVEVLSRCTEKEPFYRCSYQLTLPDLDQCPVEEEGQVFYNEKGMPFCIRGKIMFVDDIPEGGPVNLQGYDPLTGFAERAVLFETLNSLIEETRETKIPGAYLAIAIDRLALMYVSQPLQEMKEKMKQISDLLRASLRFDDFIGRISGSCFGVILKDCDRWGIVRASDRLIEAVEQARIKYVQGQMNVSVSIGGVVLTPETSDAFAAMVNAEKYLIASQTMKGPGSMGLPFNSKVQADLERPETSAEGKRRATDPSTS